MERTANSNITKPGIISSCSFVSFSFSFSNLHSRPFDKTDVPVYCYWHLRGEAKPIDVLFFPLLEPNSDPAFTQDSSTRAPTHRTAACVQCPAAAPASPAGTNIGCFYNTFASGAATTVITAATTERYSRKHDLGLLVNVRCNVFTCSGAQMGQTLLSSTVLCFIIRGLDRQISLLPPDWEGI